MAITNNWTTTLPASKLPSGASIPVVAELEGTVNKENFEVIVTPASSVDNATEATGFAALGAAVKALIDSDYDTDVFGIDPAATVTMRTVITKVRRGWDNIPYVASGEFADAEQYAAATDIFRVWGYCEWEVVTPAP